jgi:hypothetical protein
MSWKRPFEDPIALPRGRQLVTIEDAGAYITKLPKAQHEVAEWQAAMECPDPGGRKERSDNDGAHRRHAVAQSTRRAGVQPRSQRHALGKAEAKAGRMTSRDC